MAAGRWRNTLVAIKIVDHTILTSTEEGRGKEGPKEGLQLETLLSLSLCHPNIVATFRVCTMEAGALPAGSSTSGSDRASPAANAGPAAPSPDRAADAPKLGDVGLPGLPGSPAQAGQPGENAAQDAAAEAATISAAPELARLAGQPPGGNPSCSAPQAPRTGRKILLPRRLIWNKDPGDRSGTPAEPGLAAVREQGAASGQEHNSSSQADRLQPSARSRLCPCLGSSPTAASPPAKAVQTAAQGNEGPGTKAGPAGSLGWDASGEFR